jgi:transposase-like protein
MGGEELPKRPIIPQEGPEDVYIVDRGPWYPWALERLGLEYRYERFGMRNRVERFFKCLKERTVIFHHKMSARNHLQ